MKRMPANRGSALMISLVVVIITAGIGGAFMAQALYHNNEQKWSIEADEASTMCDAGMELARYAMGAYRAGTAPAVGAWKWQDMISYCKSRPTGVYGSVNGPFMKADAKTLFTSAYYGNYQQWIGSGLSNAPISYNSYGTSLLPVPTSPSSTIQWTQNDTTRGVVSLNISPAAPPVPIVIGNSIPFQRGALYITVEYPAGIAGGDPDNAVVTVTATLQSGVQRQVQGVVSKPQAVPAKILGNAAGLAAVVSNDVVSLTGSIIIDGRDHSYSGTTAITAPPPLTGSAGVFGIVSASAMSNPSNGAVGGNGNAPPHPKGTATNSVAAAYDFSSIGGYPSTPDAVLADATDPTGKTPMKNGALKAAAQAAGTYFNNATAYSNWVSTTTAANGGTLPGGNILYLDFAPGNGMFDMGPGNIQSSIMVIHTDTNSGIAQEVHGSFTGLMIADGFVRNNGNAQITGMVQLLSPTASTAGNVFGNGNAEIDYSSGALANLPGVASGGGSTSASPATLASYRRIEK